MKGLGLTVENTLPSAAALRWVLSAHACLENPVVVVIGIILCCTSLGVSAQGCGTVIGLTNMEPNDACLCVVIFGQTISKSLCDCNSLENKAPYPLLALLPAAGFRDYGNTSSASTYYVLAYLESLVGVKKGQRLMQVGGRQRLSGEPWGR